MYAIDATFDGRRVELAAGTLGGLLVATVRAFAGAAEVSLILGDSGSFLLLAGDGAAAVVPVRTA